MMINVDHRESFTKKREKVMQYIDSLIVYVYANVLILYVDAFMNEL